MLPELAHYSLILALCLAVMQAIVPLIGANKNNIAYMQLAGYTTIGQCLFITFSFSALAYSLISNDFSVSYVAYHSNSTLPFFYRFCALWGAHEGSLLLWVFILNLWMLAVSLFSHYLPLTFRAHVLAVMAIIAIGFYLFLITTSNPFTRFLPYHPADGNDLNPILQDPGLATHPPLLYMGYVGFSVAFAFAIAALLSRRLDAQWARWTRPWTIIAWCFLTGGIILGSWWAYRQLGWGGWWFWDPVENASFLPWLTATALIHSLIVTEKRNTFKAWTVLLAICVFSLSLLGTFIVRSGVLISVHAFAVDPKRGLYVLSFLGFIIGGSFTLYAWRSKSLSSGNQFSFWSRETMLLINNMILFVSMLTVLLGTLYPLIIDALHLGKLSVGAPYFNSIFIPLMLPFLILMGVGPLFHWQITHTRYLFKRSLIIFISSIVIAILLFWTTQTKIQFNSFVGLLIGLWIIMQIVSYPFIWKNNLNIKWQLPKLQQLPMLTAHLGMAILVIGIALSTAYSQERQIRIHIGETTNLGPYQIRLDNVSEQSGPNYQAVQANVAVYKNHQLLNILHPQQRIYTVQNTSVAKTAIDVNIFRDIYLALGAPMEHQSWSMRLYYKPFVRWIWLGGLCMIVGGLLALIIRHLPVAKRVIKEI